MFLFNFFLKSINSALVKYVPVGLFGLAINTSLVFLVTFLIISFIETLKFFSLEKTTFAPLFVHISCTLKSYIEEQSLHQRVLSITDKSFE